MIDGVKKKIPKRIKTYINKVYNEIELMRLVFYDFTRYRNYSFGISGKSEKEYLRAKIIINYHSIEKGLSSVSPRVGFGLRPVQNLIDVLNEYYDRGYPIEDYQFQAGLSTLINYIQFHKCNKYDVSNVEVQLKRFTDIQVAELGGVGVSYGKDFIALEDVNFEKLSIFRKSVRDFSLEPIPIATIEKAMKLAETTPSVCNRQPWRVHLISNKELIDKVLELQGGFRGFGDNVQYLFGICSDLRYLSGPTEKDQGYFDAGLYTMNLVYALTMLGVANCVLNGQFNISEDKQLRYILELEGFEKITAFIVTGSYNDDFTWTKSLRDNYTEYTTIHK